MNCKLLKNIKASCTYNPGGISEIHLLDLRDFITYRFKEDNLFNNAFVETIFRPYTSQYISLEAVSESNFTESKDAKGNYKQTLSTFVHTLSAEKLESLLLAEVNRYIVVFKTLQQTWFTFGTSEGASVSFSQLTGETTEANGYNVTITADSIYPLFEASDDVLSFKYDKVYVPEFDECETEAFVPNFEHYKCVTL